MTNLKALAEKLKTEKSVAIFCHVRPDGDAIGSALGLQMALISMGKTAKVFCADVIPDRFFFIDGASEISDKLSGKYTAYFGVDCSDEARMGDLGAEFIEQYNTYNVDHHVSNTKYASHNLVINNASNAENVLLLIKELGCEITPSIATALATGIVTDTGNFKHKNVTAETLYAAAELKQKGADLNEIIYYMFTEQSAERAKLFGITMSKLRYLLDGKLVIASILKSDFEKSGARPDETEGFIDFIMGVKGVEVGVSIMQTGENRYKCSFRSKAADVNAVAAKFGGGGHVLASGCQMQGEYEEVVDEIRYAVSQYLPD